MKPENKKELENLSKTCKNSSYIILFLGILVTFIGVVNHIDTLIISVGIFIFVIGYMYMKVSKKISDNIG